MNQRKMGDNIINYGSIILIALAGLAGFLYIPLDYSRDYDDYNGRWKLLLVFMDTYLGILPFLFIAVSFGISLILIVPAMLATPVVLLMEVESIEPNQKVVCVIVGGYYWIVIGYQFLIRKRLFPSAWPLF